MSNDYHDENGRKIYPEIHIEDNYYGIEYGEMCGVADLKGNIVIPLREYLYFIDDFEYILVKEIDSDWEVYLIGEETIEKIDYEDIHYEEYEFLAIKLQGRWQFYDLTEYQEMYDDEDYE